MIISFSHDKIWTEKGTEPTNHRPYFLIKDINIIPTIDNVIEISEPLLLESQVNWNDKIKVRKVFIEHPNQTPKVSLEYFKLGFETYEQAVPYLTRIAADLEAENKWPLNTNGEWVDLSCLIYDIEELSEKELITCIGYGRFTISLRTVLPHTIEIKIPDVYISEQHYANNKQDELQLLESFVKLVNESHIIIGHNASIFDNHEIYDKLKNYSRFDSFIKERCYLHQGFFRGKTENAMVEIYPLTFDTLLAARFLFKGESDEGYSLKRIAQRYEFPSIKNRVYEKDFGGFGKWDNNNPKCQLYNQQDIDDTFHLFKKEVQAIFLEMLITGLNFQDLLSQSNGKVADHMSLTRGHNIIINGPMMHPSKVAQSLYVHFKGKLKTKKEIFEYFRTEHFECNDSCAFDDKTSQQMRDKLLRVVKYGEEMPDYVLYYPLVLDYEAIGGFTKHPPITLTPLHNIKKADVTAEYPSIIKGKNICPETVRPALPNEEPDGWSWFSEIKYTNVLQFFNYKKHPEKGYLIGYKSRKRIGILNEALTELLIAVQQYKNKPGWEETYSKSLKPFRNAIGFGTLLNNNGTCQQFNPIAGAAVTNYGQEITTWATDYIEKQGYKIVYADTDGVEFVKSNPTKDFESCINDVETYWTERFEGYPIKFDVEDAEIKLYITHKNYITYNKENIKLTGATLHAADKPKIAEKTLKILMKNILPATYTKEEFLSKYREESVKIIKDIFNDIKIDDLIISSGVQPSENYNNEKLAQRVTVIERLLNIHITFPTKMEFIVCKNRLPNMDGEKTSQDPVAYEWPRQLVEDNPELWDLEWYKTMVYSYLETIVNFPKGSLKMNVKSLFSEFEILDTPKFENRAEVFTPLRTTISTGYFDSFEEEDFSSDIDEVKLKLPEAKFEGEEKIETYPKLKDWPTKKYGTILIDPPWMYEYDSGIGMHPNYDLLSNEEIIALPISDIAQDNCLLLLWTTNTHLPIAIKCVEKWGFKYKTIMTWDKLRSSAGIWLKGQTEHIIIGAKGKVSPPSITGIGTKWTSLIRFERTEHSKKPFLQYKLGEELGPEPRIEIFARLKLEGWDAWGNEVPDETQSRMTEEVTDEMVIELNNIIPKSKQKTL